MLINFDALVRGRPTGRVLAILGEVTSAAPIGDKVPVDLFSNQGLPAHTLGEIAR